MTWRGRRLGKDLVAGAMFIVVAIVFGVGALEYSRGTSAHPGPGYFPLGLSALLGLLGIVVLANALRRPQDDEPIEPIAWRPLLVIVAGLVAFALALQPLGLVVALPLLIVVVSAASGERFHWVGVVVLATLLTVLSWAVFVKGLGLILPVWPAFLG